MSPASTLRCKAAATLDAPERDASATQAPESPPNSPLLLSFPVSALSSLAHCNGGVCSDVSALTSFGDEVIVRIRRSVSPGALLGSPALLKSVYAGVGSGQLSTRSLRVTR
jgi:hypothetical protein